MWSCVHTSPGFDWDAGEISFERTFSDGWREISCTAELKDFGGG